MGAAFSRTEPFAIDSCSTDTIKQKIKTRLEQLPEYAAHSITLVSTQKPADTNDVCDVEYNAKSVQTSYVERDTRRVIFTAAGEVDTIGTSRSGLSYATPRPTKQAVYDYYAGLAQYNYKWNSGGWRAGNYSPPLPPWNDPVFARNIGLYNDNLKRVLAPGGAFDSTKHAQWATTMSASSNISEYQVRFQKYVAPTPAAPAPPDLSQVLLEVDESVIRQPAPPSTSDILNGATEDIQSANAAANATAAGRNLVTYDTMIQGYIDRNGPDYDPPREGDSYETLLLKFNKAYDVVAGKRTGSMDMMLSPDARSEWYKRFIGRGIEFPVPEAVIPLTTPPKGAVKYNYRPYEFSDRQNELIRYCPVEETSQKRTQIKANFCKSLGFHASEAGEELCGNICCIPLAPTPAYEEPKTTIVQPKAGEPQIPPGYTAYNPYKPASILAGIGDMATDYGPVNLGGGAQSRRPPPPKKTASACPAPKEYTIPGKTYFVQAPSTRVQNAKKSLEYIMSKPVGQCDTKPASTKEGFLTMDPSSLMKGQQQELNSAKMANLRGMGY